MDSEDDPGPVPRRQNFLTSDDLDASQRPYAPSLSGGYEDDVDIDAMAAKYVPDYAHENDGDPEENTLTSLSPRKPRKEEFRYKNTYAYAYAYETPPSRAVEKNDNTDIADPSDDQTNDNGNRVNRSRQDESTSLSLSISTESTEEFRSKYSLDDMEVSVSEESSPVQVVSLPPPVMVESSRRQDELVALEQDLKRLEHEIVTANNGVPFNLASYQQVSLALFGTPHESTSKAVLEGMAVSNILAKLILEHRQTKQRRNKLQKQEDVWAARQTKQQQQRTVAETTNGKAAVPNLRHYLNDEPLMLVDTSSFIFRAYYSMPPMHRADGLPTSAVLGFCNMLNRMILNPLLNGKQPRLVLCCDAPSPASGGPKTLRHELYPQYKAHRQEAPMDLIPQFPFFHAVAQAYGILWIEAPGYEADDVIASLSHQAMQEGLTVHIYSGDKDLMQLITNSTSAANDNSTTEKGKVEMIDPMTMTHWNHESVVEKWGVAAHQLGDVLALAGDTADNIPGVPGIGPKIAAQLLDQFGTLEELLSNLDQVHQTKRRENLELYRDQAILSQQLVRLVHDLDWNAMRIDPPSMSDQDFGEPPEYIADLRMEPMNPDRILRFYDEMGFVTIKNRLLERLKRQSRVQYTYDTSRSVAKGNAKRNSSFPRSKKTEIPKPEDYDNVPF